MTDSVSKSFYDHGWRGIHVEPSPSHASLLRDKRPDELVIESAIDIRTGSVLFYDFADTGLGTADINIAKQHIESGFKYNTITVETVTLDDIIMN